MISSPCRLKCQIIISSIPMCYVKCYKVTTFSFLKLLMLTNSIISTNHGHDILRPLGIWFQPFTNSIHDTKYHKRCSMTCAVSHFVHVDCLNGGATTTNTTQFSFEYWIAWTTAVSNYCTHAPPPFVVHGSLHPCITYELARFDDY